MNNADSQFHPPKTQSELEKFWSDRLDKLASTLETTKSIKKLKEEHNNVIIRR